MLLSPVELKHASRLVNHGPTVLIVTEHQGRRNVMAAAWSMPVEFTPPRIAVVVDKKNFTRELLQASGRFAIGLPCPALADLTYAVGCAPPVWRRVRRALAHRARLTGRQGRLNSSRADSARTLAWALRREPAGGLEEWREQKSAQDKPGWVAVITYEPCRCGTTDPIPDVADFGRVQIFLLPLTQKEQRVDESRSQGRFIVPALAKDGSVQMHS